MTQRRVGNEPAEPGADDRARREVMRLLYGAGEEALDEVPLEGEEDCEREREGDERRRRDQLDVRAELRGAA